MEFKVNTRLKLENDFMYDKRIQRLKGYDDWVKILLLYMMLVGFAERSKTGNVVAFEDGTPVPFCRMKELFNFSCSFLEYAFSALQSVNLLEKIPFQDDNVTIVATNGLFYA